VVVDWLAAAGDIASAYVSDRHSDDPAMYRCVVVVMQPGDGPSHLVHAPSDQGIWIVFTLGKGSNVQHFSTLPAALNSIRPVIGEVGSARHDGNPTVS
jgi:hypothetical protein